MKKRKLAPVLMHLNLLRRCYCSKPGKVASVQLFLSSSGKEVFRAFASFFWSLYQFVRQKKNSGLLACGGVWQGFDLLKKLEKSKVEVVLQGGLRTSLNL